MKNAVKRRKGALVSRHFMSDSPRYEEIRHGFVQLAIDSTDSRHFVPANKGEEEEEEEVKKM